MPIFNKEMDLVHGCKCHSVLLRKPTSLTRNPQLDLMGHVEAEKKTGKREGKEKERKERGLRKHPQNKFLVIALNCRDIFRHENYTSFAPRVGQTLSSINFPSLVISSVAMQKL